MTSKTLCLELYHIIISLSFSHVEILVLFQNIIYYKHKYRALIHLLCHHTIGLKGIERHLIYNYRIDFNQQTEFRMTLKNIDTAETIKAIPIPDDKKEPIKDLTIYDGYKCNNCNEMKTISLLVIRQHRYDKY